jgi:ribosomal protein S18 acetylase RimI-like enzyme
MEAFLRKHADSSMILLGNLAADGVEDRGGRFGGIYAGTFDEQGVLRAVAAHYRIGNLFAQAESEAALDAAVQLAVATSGRPVLGMIGLRWLVLRARALLGLDSAPARYDAAEGLYALDLAELREPALVADPQLELRALRASDADLVVAWRRAYNVETLGATDGAELEAQCREGFERSLARGERCLLTYAGKPCGATDFNSRLPDMVQVGGVYTPPEARSRGYARAAVGLSLRDARERGVRRAILFTGDSNVPAIKAYRSLGFERIAEYGIVLFS